MKNDKVISELLGWTRVRAEIQRKSEMKPARLSIAALTAFVVTHYGPSRNGLIDAEPSQLPKISFSSPLMVL